MKRKLLTIVLTLLVLLGLSLGITYFTHTKFIDYSFFIGLVAPLLFGFLLLRVVVLVLDTWI